MTIENRIETIAELLSGVGVTHAFGICGSGPSLTLIGALDKRGITYINASHEASAAMMAGAATRVSGVPALSISIKGPGLVNAVAGISYNHFEDTPSISISESYGPDSPAWRMHKRIDQFGLLSPIVKRYCSISEFVHNPREIMSETFAETPGPLHIDLFEGTSKGSQDRIKESKHLPSSLSSAISRIGAAVRPLVILGSVTKRVRLEVEIASLKLPILTTAAARGVLSENSPFAAGIFTGDGKEHSLEVHLLSACDLVIAIGVRTSEITGQNFGGRPILRFDYIESTHVRDFPKPIEHDISCSLNGLKEVFSALESLEWGNDLASELRIGLLDYLNLDQWLPAQCFKVIDDLKIPHALALDTGSFCTIGEHVWRANRDRILIGSNNGRFMGGSIPSSIGMAIAAPGIPVYCAVGDGGIQAYPAELKLIMALKLPICILFMSDGQYGSIACAAPDGSSMSALMIKMPSWYRVAEAMGMNSARCENGASFREIIDNWDRQSPLFIECIFDRSAYLVMTKGLR